MNTFLLGPIIDNSSCSCHGVLELPFLASGLPFWWFPFIFKSPSSLPASWLTLRCE